MVKLAEILLYILRFFFLISDNLAYPLHYLTNGRVSLLSFFHFWWRHLAQNLNHTGVQFQFFLGRFVLFILNGHLTFCGKFLPIDYFFQLFKYHCIQKSFIFLRLWITVHLSWDIGMMAKSVCFFTWLNCSVFNIKIQQHKFAKLTDLSHP